MLRLLESFKYAFRGMKYVLREQTIKILLVIASLVIISMIYLGVSSIEKTVLLLTITVVLSLEMINSQIEDVLDILEPTLSQKVRAIKDVSAGAVLLASLGALLIGLLIFLPYVIPLLGF